jgi:ribosome-associated protein
MERGLILPGDDAISRSRTLCLDQFLKLSSIAETGGHAKTMIQNGEVKVNGQTETRRRRKLARDDVVEVGGGKWLVRDSASFD